MEEKKAAARLLYLDGFSQTRIAELLRISANTVSNWKREGGWDAERTETLLFQETSAERVRQLISYQLDALTRQVEIWQDGEKVDEDGNPIPPPLLSAGQIDGLYKLINSIKGTERKWIDYVNVLKEATEFVGTADPALARRLTGHFDNFLNAKRRSIK